MSNYDLIIRNATLVLPQGEQQADIAIADEHIAAIMPELEGSAQVSVDAQGLHVFPGLIDMHVHCNEPGRTEWEGFASVTQALAAGGVTTFFDMSMNAHPPTLDRQSFQLKLAAAHSTAMVDFALWGGLTPDNRSHLEELAACGVIGFKALMAKSGTNDIALADDLTLYEGMAQAAKLGRIVAVHAENEQITSGLAQRALSEGRTGIRDYLRSRPIVAELEAMQRAILFASETGCALHIAHVSSGRGVVMVAEAQARGVDVSCETCPHYLVLTQDDVEQLGAVAKSTPPIRDQQEQDALWQYVRDGRLAIISSNHSPIPASMKTGEDFFAVWSGIASCQSTLSLLLSEGYHKRHIPLALIAAATGASVARRFRLPQKGKLVPGAEADFALVDLQQTYALTANELFYRHPHSPYLGQTLRGKVVQTFLRGTLIYDHGQIVSEPNGRLLTAAGFRPRALVEGLGK